ncbi:MAG: OmpP1/FadL family transporter [Bacteroidota bacterium]|nr:OmpP1/FadL family transporter [Bacteroidota bacterium]
MKKIILSIAVSMLFLSIRLQASGFQINEHNARVMAMGGAFAGLANDPSAVYYNPAGITQLFGTHFSLGATYISPTSTFTGPAPSTTESKLKKKFFTPANFYFTQSLGSNFFVGFGFNDPFGLGTEWEDDWVGRYRTTKTEIKTYNFSPVVAYKISDMLSVSAGFTVSYADVLIGRKLQLLVPVGQTVVQLPDANLELKGHNTAFGYTAGLLFKPMDNLGLGVAFHSQIKYDMKGDATTTVSPTTPAAVVAALPKGSITAPLTTPAVLTIGGSYRVFSSLLFNADYQYNGWSSYDKLEVNFNDLPKSSTNPSVSVRDYKNSYILRAGSEYILNDQVALRGGILFDKNPIKDEKLDPTLPDADRWAFNIGFGYKFTPNFSVDVAYMYLLFKDRTIDTSEEFIPIRPIPQRLNGTYKSSANLFGVNLSYSL